MLKEKMEFDFAELRGNPQFLLTIKDSLLKILVRYKHQETYILKELCAALTYFCVHMHKDWPVFLTEIQSKFNFTEIMDNIAYLRTLESLGEDFSESKLVVEDEIRAGFKKLLCLSVHQIFPQLENFSQIVP